MSSIQANYPCGRPPIPPPYTQNCCTNTLSSPTTTTTTESISYPSNNGAASTPAPVYPSPNPHHHRRNSGNVRYNPYHHSRQTSAAAPGAPVGPARSTTCGHDGQGAEVPYLEHTRRSFGEPHSSNSRRPRLPRSHPNPTQPVYRRRQSPPSSFVIYAETDDSRSGCPAPICAGTDGATYYPVPVCFPPTPTYTSQPQFGGHAASHAAAHAAPRPGQGDTRVLNASPAGALGNLPATTASATATTTYTHEPFGPSSAFPHTPAPLLTFDSQAQYAKSSLQLTEHEYSYDQQQQPQYYQPDPCQSIVQSDVGVADDTAAAGFIQSLFTDSLDVNLSAGYTPNCTPDRLASLGFTGPEGSPSSFQGTQPQHVYGHQSTAFAPPAPYFGVQDFTPFTPVPGGDCPTPALIPPTPKPGSSSSFLHPVPLPCNEPTAAGQTHCNSSEPATPPFLVPSSAGLSMFASASTMPFGVPLPPPPSTKPCREACTPADLVRDPTLKFPHYQRSAAARALEHVKNKPNVPIPTAFLGPPLSSAVVMKDGVQRARCLCEGCIGIGDDSGHGEGWRRLDHLWCHMRKEHFGCVVYRCTEW